MASGFGICLLIGVLTAGLLVPAVTLTADAATSVGAGFVSTPAELNVSDLPQTSELLASDGSPLAYFYNENRLSIPLAQMGSLMPQAIVAIEDSRFYSDGALDPRGVLRASVVDSLGDSTQGASTLTQQYVKNVLLQTAVATNDKAGAKAAVAQTAERKLRELRLAVGVNRTMTKQQVLEGYLNIAYFGENSYGVQTASERYFGVPPAQLSLPQAALLAGIVRNPSGYDPVTHPGAAKARRDLVLTKMREQNMITPAQLAAATESPVTVTGSPLPNGCTGAGQAGFFCQYVIESIVNDNRYSALGTTRAERRQAIEQGGLVISTTLDPASQAAAESAADRGVPPTDRSGVGVSAVTVAPGSGDVVAMTQNRTFSNVAAPGATSINYATDSQLGGSTGFQTGSSFKPFTLATWLAQGHSLYASVDATQRGFPFSSFSACGQRLHGSKAYVPGNSEGRESGRMSVLQATADSVNVAYVDMETRLDLCNVANTAQSLGVHLAAPASVCNVHQAPSTAVPTCLPSLTLGVEDIAPLTMAAAYAGFASGGMFCQPLPVTQIARASLGTPPTPVATYSPQCRQALSPGVASGVNTALRQVLTSGTAASVGPLGRWASAGKTGTTNGPYDTWFVGYTAQRSTAVWVGDPGKVVDGKNVRRRLTNIDIDGSYYSTVYGASVAAPIWKATMQQEMLGLPNQGLP